MKSIIEGCGENLVGGWDITLYDIIGSVFENTQSIPEERRGSTNEPGAAYDAVLEARAVIVQLTATHLLGLFGDPTELLFL